MGNENTVCIVRCLAVKEGDFVGYGRPHPEKQWRFDLEKVNKTLVKPKKKTEG